MNMSMILEYNLNDTFKNVYIKNELNITIIYMDIN